MNLTELREIGLRLSAITPKRVTEAKQHDAREQSSEARLERAKARSRRKWEAIKADKERHLRRIEKGRLYRKRKCEQEGREYKPRWHGKRMRRKGYLE